VSLMFSSRPILLVFALLATYAWGAVIRPRGGAWEKSDLTRRQDEPKAAEVLLHCTVPGTAAITFVRFFLKWSSALIL